MAKKIFLRFALAMMLVSPALAARHDRQMLGIYGVAPFHDPSAFEPAMKKAKDAGFVWVRFPMAWNKMQKTPPTFDSPNIDWNTTRDIEQEVRALKQEGFKIMVLLGGVPRWAHCKNWAPDCRVKKHFWNRAPVSPKYYRYFTEKLAEHFAGLVDAYEIWNEPNWGDFFAGSNPDEFKKFILFPGIDGIKRGDPKALTVGPTLLSNTDFDKWIGTGKYQPDVISLHIYGSVDEQQSRLDDADDWCSSNVKCHRHGFWVTEFGFPTNEDPTASRTLEVFNHCKTLATCRKMFVFYLFDFKDHLNSGFENFGLLNVQGEVKKRYCEVQKFLTSTSSDDCMCPAGQFHCIKTSGGRKRF